MKKKGKTGKQIASLILCIAMIISMMPMSSIVVYATGGILIDDTNFHDEQFRKYLIESDFNANHDTTLTDAEIANATCIEITNDYNITDLHGIDKLTSLEGIWIYNNSLKNVDLSAAPWIEFFYASNLELETLNLSGCSSLNYLEIYGNNLTSLDLTDCTSLIYLVCNNNKLERIDISNTALLEYDTVPFLGSQKDGIQIKVNMTTEQRMKFNKLPSSEYNQNIIIIDPSRPEGFIVVDGTNFPDENLRSEILKNNVDQNSDNMLSTAEIVAVKTLDLSGINIEDTTGLEIFTELESLTIDNAGLESLDVTHFKKLKKLSFKDNSLTYIILDQNPLLEELYCDNNALLYLNFDNNKNLASLTCSDNALNNLDISGTKVATSATVNCALGYSEKEGNITLTMTDAQSDYFYNNIVTKSNVAGNKGIFNHPHDERLLNSISQVNPTEKTYGVKEYFECSYCGATFEDNLGVSRIDDIEAWKNNEGRIDKIEPAVKGEFTEQPVDLKEELGKTLYDAFTFKGEIISAYLEKEVDGAWVDWNGLSIVSEEQYQLEFSSPANACVEKYRISVYCAGSQWIYSDEFTITWEESTWKNIHWDGNIARWDDFAGATNYWVYLLKDGSNPSGGGYSTNSNNYIDFTERMTLYGSGNYTFYVVPYIDGAWQDYMKSQLSGTNNFVLPAATLEAPTDLRWDNVIAIWNPSENGQTYSINLYKDGELVKSSIDVGKETFAYLNGFMDEYGTGKYSFEVCTFGVGTVSEWSVRSEEISYTQIPRPTGLKLDGAIASWKPVDKATDYWYRLYKDGVEVSVGYTGNATTYDFTEKMKELGEGVYDFRVAAYVGGVIGRTSLLASEESTHEHHWSTTWTIDSNSHWYACFGCDEKMDEESHIFSKYVSNGDDTHKVVCKDCDAVQTGHDKDACSGGTATCTSKATCSKCGEEYGELASHDFSAKDITKATTTANGQIVTKCSVCGEINSTKTIKAAKTIKLSATTYTYDGKAKKPTVTVKDSAGTTLKKDTDYTVTYATGRKAVGKYKVTIKGKGKYSFTKELTFKINPVKTSITSLTKGTKSFTVKWAKKTTQTTGYEIQYSTSSTFKAGTATKKVIVKSNKTTSKTIKSLKAKKKYYVRVRTYKTVSGTKYYSAWCTKKYVTTK